MKVKRAIFAALLLSVVLATILQSQAAIDTRQIDEVLKKQVLDSGDLQIIDEFLAEAVQELVKTRDFTSIAKTRTIILSRRSAQAQYAQQFSESAHKYISSGLTEASELPEERQFKVVLNLLILIDGLEDPRLTDLPMGRLKDKSKAIRYWAVRCITNPGLIRKLNPTEAANLRLAQRITQQLKALVDSGDHEILALMTEFADQIKIPEGQDLLLQIADTRIKRYEDWTVRYELLDSAILKSLFNKITSAGLNKPTIAGRFAQLYYYAIQRYISGQDFSTDNSKHYLASVLVETEEKCIGKLLGLPQSTIRRAVERDDLSLLVQERDRLFGDQTTAGQLQLKLNIDFGKDPSGKKRIAPFDLPDPPKK